MAEDETPRKRPDWEPLVPVGTPTLRFRVEDDKPPTDDPVNLVRPVSYAERWDVFTAQNPQRAVTCALGLCWPKLRKALGKRGAVYHGDPMTYGGHVTDYLTSRGASIGDIMQHAVRAHALCIEGLIGDTEVDAARGNS